MSSEVLACGCQGLTYLPFNETSIFRLVTASGSLQPPLVQLEPHNN